MPITPSPRRHAYRAPTAPPCPSHLRHLEITARGAQNSGIFRSDALSALKIAEKPGRIAIVDATAVC
jgi:hypothetical protein